MALCKSISELQVSVHVLSRVVAFYVNASENSDPLLCVEAVARLIAYWRPDVVHLGVRALGKKLAASHFPVRILFSRSAFSFALRRAARSSL